MDHKSSQSHFFQIVGFLLGDEEFGVDILQVQEIIRMVEITKVPKSPSFVEGVINLRGRVIPIVDLRKRFNLEVSTDGLTRIIIVSIKNRRVGFIVDSVKKVIQVEKRALREAPPISTGVDSTFILGVAQVEERLLMILDLNKLLSLQETVQLSNVAPKL